MAEDKVGRNHPPVATRWQKGGPSPHPQGRPRKRKSVDDLCLAELSRLISITERRADGSKKTIKITAVQWLIRQWIIRSGKGDKHADNILRDLILRYGRGIFTNAREVPPEDESKDTKTDAGILEAFARDLRERDQRIGDADA
jgi:hypothetical protein